MKTINNFFHIALYGFFVFPSLYINAETIKTDPTNVVYKLYKDFAWEAVIAEPENARSVFGGSVAEQPKNILEKYFDSNLSILLFNDAECTNKGGEVCKLDFDPIFASQDTAAHSLTVRALGSNIVAVEFLYPSNNTKVRLEYKLTETAKGWRISDIVYKSKNNASLINILKDNPHLTDGL